LNGHQLAKAVMSVVNKHAAITVSLVPISHSGEVSDLAVVGWLEWGR